MKRFATARNVADNPAGLAALIGKKPNQVYNLLHGTSSFGEKVARSIEEAAGLPRYWLDTEEPGQPGALSAPVAAFAAQIEALSPPDRDKVLALCQDIVNLARKSVAQSEEPQGDRKLG